MAHDRFVCIRTILGNIGVGEALEGITVAGFGIQPGLLDRKAKTGMIKSRLRRSKGVPEARAAKATAWAAP